MININLKICFFFLGIKQTAKLVNSTLMELINSVDDNTNNTEEVTPEVKMLIKKINIYLLKCFFDLG